MRFVTLVFIFASFLYSHELEIKSITWKQYYRGGIVYSKKSKNGYAGYFRLKRITKNTFKDIRLFGHIFPDDVEIRIRQKSSRKFLSFDKIYSFNTLIYEKNTILDIGLRYQYNQGLGLLLKKNKSGNQTFEIGIALDNEDYINTKQRKTYAKTGLSIDYHINVFSTKFEIDYFYHLNKLYSDPSLSRFQILGELQWIITKNFGAMIGFTLDVQQKNSSPSAFFTISIADNLDWKF